MRRYSAFAIAREAFNYQQGWERAWRSPEPKAQYDVIIIGAGGHGLATAYYLAKNHGITDVAVLEKGWLGGGNTGRNTTIIRSNYLQPASSEIFELSRSLYEDLSQKLNFNIMFSPRGVLIRSGVTISLLIAAMRLACAVRFQARSSCSVWASMRTPRGLNMMLKFSFWLRSS